MYQKNLYLLLLVIGAHLMFAQGPPILLDKPIMLGANKGTIRPFAKILNQQVHDFTAFVLEADYNISNQIAIGAEIPTSHHLNKLSLGDLTFMAKYQFYKKDGTAKTTRVAIKAKQMFATGKSLETMILGMGHPMTYLGFSGAKESLKLGIQSELGYYFSPSASHLNFFTAKAGFGLPLLKPTYPVKQINLYLESEATIAQSHAGQSQYGIYIAPGIQYAKGIYTFDFSYQLPITQRFHHLTTYQKHSSIFIGTRVII